MKFQCISKKDIPAITKLAAATMIHDHFSEELIEEKCFGDPGYTSELNWVVKEGNTLTAFAIGAYRDYDKGKFGYIKLMSVDPEYRRNKIGTQLVQKIADETKKMGATELKVMDVPLNYFMPGVDPRYTEGIIFLLKSGFDKVAEHVNMNVDLISQDLKTDTEEKKLAKEGIIIRRATPEDKEIIFKFSDAYWQLWNHEISQTYNNNPITLHIAIDKDRVAAFSAHSGNNIGLPWFGPMGTDPEYRGKMLGEILLKRCLADQKNMGFRYSIIPWVGPIGFYLKAVDAHISRVFWAFKKNLVPKKEGVDNA